MESAASALEESNGSSSSPLLAHSNQWEFDRENTFLYPAVESSSLFTNRTQTSHFLMDFNKKSYLYPELRSYFRVENSPYWALWVGYLVGVLQREGRLTDLRYNQKLSAENAEIMALPLEASLTVAYQRWKWIQPYAGYQGGGQFYRLSSSMSGVEKQGFIGTHGWVLGLHLPVLRSWGISAMVQWTQRRLYGASRTLSQNSNDWAAGLGWYF